MTVVTEKSGSGPRYGVIGGDRFPDVANAVANSFSWDVKLPERSWPDGTFEDELLKQTLRFHRAHEAALKNASNQLGINPTVIVDHYLDCLDRAHRELNTVLGEFGEDSAASLPVLGPYLFDGKARHLAGTGLAPYRMLELAAPIQGLNDARAAFNRFMVALHEAAHATAKVSIKMSLSGGAEILNVKCGADIVFVEKAVKRIRQEPSVSSWSEELGVTALEELAYARAGFRRTPKTVTFRVRIGFQFYERIAQCLEGWRPRISDGDSVIEITSNRKRCLRIPASYSLLENSDGDLEYGCYRFKLEALHALADECGKDSQGDPFLNDLRKAFVNYHRTGSPNLLEAYALTHLPPNTMGLLRRITPAFDHPTNDEFSLGSIVLSLYVAARSAPGDRCERIRENLRELLGRYRGFANVIFDDSGKSVEASTFNNDTVEQDPAWPPSILGRVPGVN